MSWFKFLSWLTIVLGVSAHAALYEIPYMPRGDDLEHQGFLRITNLSTLSASVEVFGVKDDSSISPRAGFSIPANATVGFRITELETGNLIGTQPNPRNLSGSIGTAGAGDWRIVFESISSLTVVGYYRNPVTGF